MRIVSKELLKAINKQLSKWGEVEPVTSASLERLHEKQEANADRRHRELKHEVSSFHISYAQTAGAMCETLSAMTKKPAAPTVSGTQTSSEVRSPACPRAPSTFTKKAKPPPAEIFGCPYEGRKKTTEPPAKRQATAKARATETEKTSPQQEIVSTKVVTRKRTKDTAGLPERQST
ncbi:hypothetical protein CYMTET_12308 [Cymbomonas tetramitiformis]|uniref:Uncharacterized protein n=1 Tax=Cymbomonas tetramitiformis TaxID=36881 RepID=A0AAE0LCA3_9CHLO|nr:hypothetical protein CYMTET_12308 [Cymbomonas tetramitiformis]